MKFGVYGCRHMHIAQAAEQLLTLGHTCVGVYEPHGAQCEKLTESLKLTRVTDAQALFARSPELILCASINNEKIDVVELCEQRGLPIMLDKPIVTCRKDYERLKAVVQRRKIKVGMMLTERFNPAIHALRKEVEAGTLGKIISLSIAKPHKLSPSIRDSWHFSKAQNGGPILDLMVHDFDLIRMLTQSEIADTTAYLGVGNREGYPDFYDDAKVLAMTESGVTVLMAADWWTPDSFPCFGNGRIVCTGTKGRCEVYTTGDPLLCKEPCAILSNADVEEQRLPHITPAKNLMEDFLCYLAGDPADLTGEDILRTSYACVVADEAARRVTVKGRTT